jgi:hypothetical protein
MNLEKMINYLENCILYETADDIYQLPREEFSEYVKRCKNIVPDRAIPYVVLVLLREDLSKERSSFKYKLKHLFKRSK